MTELRNEEIHGAAKMEEESLYLTVKTDNTTWTTLFC